MRWTVTPNHRENTFIYLQIDKNNKLEWKYLNVFIRFKVEDKNYQNDINDEIREWLTEYVHEKVILSSLEQRQLVNEEIFDVVYFEKPFTDYFPETEKYVVNFYYPLAWDV